MANHNKILLTHKPGFADVPDANFGVDHIVVGADIARVVENASFGLVSTEIFLGNYFNGDTVDLPVSTVDGYEYSRDELVYAWAATSTGEGKTGWPSYNGMIWFFQWFVDPDTGVVTTEVYYVGDQAGKKSQKTNDGILQVWVFATRKKHQLTLSSQPEWQEVSDADLAGDKPLLSTIARKMNESAKFTAVRSEAIYMGTYKNGQQIAHPVSPVDGYVYPYDRVTWKWSWVWSTDGDAYQAPSLPDYACLDRIRASVDGSGNVSTTVEYHNVSDGPERTLPNGGRLAIVAMCHRTRPTSGTTLDEFVPMDASEILGGNTVDTGFALQLMKNIRMASISHEYFDAGQLNCGDVVPLPVSPCDGYEYERDELWYLWEIDDSNNGPNPRLYNWWALAVLGDDAPHGFVAGQIIQKVTRVPWGSVGDNGVTFLTDDTDFTVRVWTVAIRRQRRQGVYGEGTGNTQSGSNNPGSGGIVEGGGVSAVLCDDPPDLYDASVLNPTTLPEIQFTKKTVTKNKFLAGPITGADADWTLREVDKADLGTGASPLRVLRVTSGGTAMEWAGLPSPGVGLIRKVGLSVDGLGLVIALGSTSSIQVDFDGTIIGWSIEADAVGSITIEVSKKAGTQTVPAIPTTSGDKISATAPITLSSARTAGVDATGLTGWTTAVAKWDTFKFNITACSGIKAITVWVSIQQ